MKKEQLAKLALLGLSSGALITAQLSAADTKSAKPSDSKAKTESYDDSEDGNMGYHLMTEDELLLQLNADGIKMYQSLTPEGKALARKVASARCNGTNDCAGLNACAGDGHDCAGKGSCKGKSKCAVGDKNLAVKLVYDKMAKKRAGLSPNN